MTTKVAVVGLGYVGLPLAVAFGKRFDTLGYDVSERRLDELSRSVDRTGETTEQKLRGARRLVFTHEAPCLRDADIVIVAVPTLIDEARQPICGHW